MTITYNTTNYFLLECKDGYLLIDAGWYGKIEQFLAKLDSLGIKPNQIKYILLTHHHHDHAAIVQELREKSGAKLIVHRKQIEYITKGFTDGKSIKQINWLLWLIDKMLFPFLKTEYNPITIKPDDYIMDSEIDDIVLRNIGINGKIITTPGHSMDSISVVLDNGTAFIGDLAMNIMGLISKPPLPIEAENYEQVKDSLRKIIQLGVNELYPSHGDKIEKSMVEKALNSRR